MRKLGLYLHVPFCYSKCSYCDFNSYAGINESLIGEYFRAMKKEIDVISGSIEQSIVNTVFIGGGTPTFVNSSYICDLIEYCTGKLKIEGAEISIESNPGSIDKQKVKDYIKSGINRASIGLQSYDENILRILGRTHTPKQFDESYNCLREGGFDNVNVDLIFGVPNQTIYSWKKTLEHVKSLFPEHISTYSLKVEDSTVLARKLEEGLLPEPEDDVDRDMYQETIKFLLESGYTHYETSNFSLKGKECRHNVNYWSCGEYIGIGAAAHGYLQDERYGNVADIGKYISLVNQGKRPVADVNIIERDEKIVEFIILGLRMIEGISFLEFENRFKTSFYDLYKVKIDNLVVKKMVITDQKSLKLTLKGLDLMNQVLVEFM